MNRRGFTVIELMAAMAVGGMCLAILAGLGHTVLATAASQRTYIEDHERRMEGALWLREAIANAATGLEGSSPFVGTESSATFSTYLATARGWPEPVTVRLALEADGIWLRGSHVSVRVLPDARSLDVDYLGTLGASSPWLRGWNSAVDIPLALRLRVEQGGRLDTLVLRTYGSQS